MNNNIKSAKAPKSSPDSKMTFWTITPEGKVKINQYKLTKFLEQGGFFKITTKSGKSVVRVVDNIVSDAPDHELIDYVIRQVGLEEGQSPVRPASSLSVPRPAFLLLIITLHSINAYIQL